MRLVHFSPTPVTTIERKSHYPFRHGQQHDMKPGGLWVSDEDEGSGMSWSEWSRSERFRLDHFDYAYEVELAPTANILFLRSVEDIDRFTVEMAVPIHPGDTSGIHIDWGPTTENYDGIIITPYQWERRLMHGYSWYYSWDCASGCIWNTDAIQRPIRQIPAPDMSDVDPVVFEIVTEPLLIEDRSKEA